MSGNIAESGVEGRGITGAYVGESSDRGEIDEAAVVGLSAAAREQE